MLTSLDLTVHARRSHRALISRVTTEFELGKLHAIIGPSGCGKTTFLKALIGTLSAQGQVRFNGIDPTAQSLAGVVGFAPQFSIAFPKLSVLESVEYAVRLYRSDVADRGDEARRLLALVGLSEQNLSSVDRLSGGQLRRLGLAMELSANPEFLLCDEVTSGLDPVAETEILQLLRRLCREEGKTVLCVIHNLDALEHFDSITLFYRGELRFQGPLASLRHAFGIADVRDCYHALVRDEAVKEWSPLPFGLEAASTRRILNRPNPFSQLITLLRRRFSLFLRDRGQLALFLALTFGFPCLVVIFALNGLPQVQTLSLEAQGSIIEQFQKASAFQMQAAKTGALVSGLIMFQVILLSLMGSNNGSREIVAERPIYEKERLCGLTPHAYIVSKLVFVGSLCVFQGCWMAFFVKWICEFPGSWIGHALVLSGVTTAIGFLCLGLSSILSSTERSSLFALYFVGFQLPLSGVVLALPHYLVWLVRPVIGAYWGWSGYLSLMKETRLYDVVKMTVNSEVVPIVACLLTLTAHMLLGGIMTVWGCLKRQSL